MKQAQFTIGQIVHHRLFDYRGVIVDVDFQFQGSDEWYDTVALSRPPKDQPWYHILVDNGGYESYVAERNLEPSQLLDPVNHPFVASFFQELKDGVYVPSRRKN